MKLVPLAPQDIRTSWATLGGSSSKRPGSLRLEKAPHPLPSHSSLRSTLTLHMTCIVRQTIGFSRVPIYPSHSVKNDEKFCAAHIEKEAAERPSLSVSICLRQRNTFIYFIIKVDFYVL